MRKITRREFDKVCDKHGINCNSPQILNICKELGIEIVDDPKPLRLECEVEFAEGGDFAWIKQSADMTNKLKPFIGKRTRMILEEIV